MEPAILFSGPKLLLFSELGLSCEGVLPRLYQLPSVYPPLALQRHLQKQTGHVLCAYGLPN